MQNDNNQPQPPTGSETQPVVSPPVNPASGEHVVAPTIGVMQEPPVSQQPAQPVVAAPQPPVQPQTQPKVNTISPVRDAMPVGMSASQLGLDGSHHSINWAGLIKKGAVTVVVLVVLAGGFLLLKNVFSSMGTKTLTNGGYTYSFVFYKSANKVALPNGSQAFKYQDTTVAGVVPTNENPPSACWNIGAQWKEVFTVQAYGATWPVCSPSGVAMSDYTMYFKALNHAHLFTIAYSSQQPATIYPQLQTIFSSVKVSQ